MSYIIALHYSAVHYNTWTLFYFYYVSYFYYFHYFYYSYYFLGTTLQYVFQSVVPFPLFIRKIVSKSVKSAINFLLPLIKTGIWDTLKIVAFSSFFRIVLEGAAFMGGFPPEQPTYFHSYMKDVFHTRYEVLWSIDSNYFIMIWYDMIWCIMIWYDMIWCDMIWYDMKTRVLNIKYYALPSSLS